MDIEDALRDKVMRFLGLVATVVINGLDLFSNLESLLKNHFDFDLIGFGFTKSNPAVYIHFGIIVLCLVIYYSFLRKWAWSKFIRNRFVFGIAFLTVGLFVLLAGLLKDRTLWPIIVLSASYIALVWTILWTLIPGVVYFKKFYAKLARWFDRLNRTGNTIQNV